MARTHKGTLSGRRLAKSKAGTANKNHKPGLSHHRLRIIAGQWRGRRLTFPALEGLRPTPDRVRETLFNWLMPKLSGSHCLDMFAGSGVLGLEALSRGAEQVLWLERHASAREALKEILQQLQVDTAWAVHTDALGWLASYQGPAFDLVFLDPPFGQNLLAPACCALQRPGLLAPGAWVYLEAEQALEPLPVPEDWRLHRQHQAGQVHYALFKTPPFG